MTREGRSLRSLLRSPRMRAAACPVLLGAAYVSVGLLGPRIDLPVITAVWPAAGVALAGLVLCGLGAWPAVAAGSVVIQWTTTGSLALALAQSAGNTLEAVIGAAVVTQFAGGRRAFHRARTTFRFASLVAVFAAPVAATIGALSLVLAGVTAWTDYVYVWMAWWLSSVSAHLIVAPAVFLWLSPPRLDWRWIRTVEAAVLGALLTGVILAMFGGRVRLPDFGYPLELLGVPLLLWAAFRFTQREVATAFCLLAPLAVAGTLDGFGPFVPDSPRESLVVLEAFLSVTAILSLALAAVVTDYREAEREFHGVAGMDPLTGLPDYRRLIGALQTEIARCRRTRRDFSVLFLDVEGLDRVNAAHGREAGDRVLVRVAATLHASVRALDTAARFGTDEFALVLPETTPHGAEHVLARVATRLAADADEIPVRVTGGIAVYPLDGATPAELLAAADRARRGEPRRPDSDAPRDRRGDPRPARASR